MAPGRFAQLRWLQNVVCVVALLVAALLTGAGLIQWGSGGGTEALGLAAVGVLLAFLAVVFAILATLVIKIESTSNRQLDALREIQELMEKQQPVLGSIAENARISDSARALAHREQEIEALRTAIRNDLRAQKWEAALYLVNEIERRFGFKDEADGLREEVDDARQAGIEARLNEAVELIEGHFGSYDWSRAQAEMDRLLQALPDNSRVLVLQDRMRTLKEDHKQELKSAWSQAVQRADTDHAIEVLKELDQYLSSAEAKELQDSARDVFKEKLLQLGIQFRFAVNEKRWQDALTSGLEIVRDYPNARMAAEVREALDTLRERARTTADATAGEAG